jgi:predicted secreted Zn-dependent protease
VQARQGAAIKKIRQLDRNAIKRGGPTESISMHLWNHPGASGHPSGLRRGIAVSNFKMTHNPFYAIRPETCTLVLSSLA